MYYTIEIDNELLTDYFGNVLKFDDHEDANEYIVDRIEYLPELEKAVITRQDKED